MYNQPKAITADYTNPFRAAGASFKNMLLLVVDFMYGSPERVRLTYTFAFALALLGATLMGDAQGIPACAAG